MDLLFTAGAGAIFGACITGAWNIAKDICNRRVEAKTLRNGLIAEVKSLDHIMRERQYRVELEKFLSEMRSSGQEILMFKAHMGDDFNPVYKANIPKLGMLDSDLGAKIIKFHAYLYALACDFHEKSVFQEQGYDIETLENMIKLFKDAEILASSILSNP